MTNQEPEDEITAAYMQPIREDVMKAVAYLGSRSMEDKVTIDDETMMSVLIDAIVDILAIDGGDKINQSQYTEPLSSIVGVAGQLLARSSRAKVVLPTKGMMVN